MLASTTHISSKITLTPCGLRLSKELSTWTGWRENRSKRAGGYKHGYYLLDRLQNLALPRSVLHLSKSANTNGININPTPKSTTDKVPSSEDRLFVAKLFATPDSRACFRKLAIIQSG